MEDFDESTTDSFESDYSCEGVSEISDNNNESYADQQVVTTEKVIQMMEAELTKVCGITGLTLNKARSLLNKLRWDSEKLLEIIYEGGQNVMQLMENSWKFVPADIKDSFTCGICYDDIPDPANIKIFPCNHRCCLECLSNYVTHTIKEEGGLLSNAIKCPGLQCSYEIDDEIVIANLKEPTLKTKYQQVIANSFVQNNRLMKWCPNASCQNALLVNPWIIIQLYESVRCSCGFYFCFSCHAISHDPVPCSMLIDWAKVKKEDMEVQDWILKNTKPCPNCKINIQKHGGCMHMTCTKCRHEFCWDCMGLWARGHFCVRQELVSTEEGPGESLRRFMTYNARYETMRQAYNLDVNLYKHKMVQNIELELEMQFVKIEFVAPAVELLLECRRTLMHSYIFSYFMTTIDNQMYIFEENLKYLGQCTEQLSEALESNVTAENMNTLKHQIIDKTAMCSARRRTLLNHIREGHENEWWRKFPITVDELVAAELQLDAGAADAILY